MIYQAHRSMFIQNRSIIERSAHQIHHSFGHINIYETKSYI